MANGAVTAYRFFHREDEIGKKVRWLFRGTVALPDHDDYYVAVYVVEHSGRDVVVTSSARRRQVDAKGISIEDPQGLTPENATSAWVDDEVPVTPAVEHIGVYLEYTDLDALPMDGGDYRDVLFVLAEPAARSLTWTQHPVAYALQAVSTPPALGGRLQSDDGVFIGAVGGPLAGEVTVVQADARGHRRAAAPFGTGSTPGLAKPAPLDPPPGFQQRSASVGQTERQSDGSWSQPAAFYDAGEAPLDEIAVLVRCYGGGSLLFRLSPADHDQTGDAVTASGRVPCDGAQHEATRHRAPAQGFIFDAVGADRLMAYRYAAYTVG